MGKDKKALNKYIRFSNIAIQMGILITAAALGGKWLDEKQENNFPGWTLSLILIAIAASLYQIIGTVIKLGKEDDKEGKKRENN